MPSFLEQVLAAKDSPPADVALSPDENEDEAHTLSNGVQIYDSTIAVVDRILSLNPYLHRRPMDSSSTPYAVFNGHTPVDLADKQTFLSLLQADWVPRTPFQVILAKQLITERLPIWSRDCIVISDHLLWDRATATLRPYTDHSRIYTVS